MESNGHILTVDGLTKTFEGVCALDDVSFGIKRGSIKALIGPNGAGKTTLLNIINGLIRPDRGSIYFKSRDISKAAPNVVAELGMGRTFQLVRLFTINNATVLDNLLIGATVRIKPKILKVLCVPKKITFDEKREIEKARSMLDFVGLRGAEMSRPGTLSFGNQRLLELARALMMEPEMLLLDEPASGLNDVEVEAFKDLITSIKQKGITVLIVEHNMKLVMDIADDIVVLNFGRKIAEGTPEKISSDPEVIRAYLGSAVKSKERALC